MTVAGIDTSSKSTTYDALYYDYYGGVGPYCREGTVWVEHFKGVAREIVKWLRPRRTLEFGCALGFLVEALRDGGVDAWGADLSDFAISRVRDDIKPFCSLRNILATPETQEHYDLVICIEVLEHLSAEEGERAIANLCRLGDEVLFSSTPDESHPDPTHQNVRPADDWIEIFRRCGFERDPNAKVSFAAPHAMLFRRRGALRITLLCTPGEPVDDLRSLYRSAGRLAESGHLVTLASWDPAPSGPAGLDPRVRCLPLPADPLGFIEALPYGCALIGNLATTAALAANAPRDRGRRFCLEPANRLFVGGEAGGNDSAGNAFAGRRTALSAWLEDIRQPSEEGRPDPELDAWGYPMEEPEALAMTPGGPRLSIGILAGDPDHTACFHIRLKSPLQDLHRKGLAELVSIQELRNGKLSIDFEAARKLDVLVVQRHLPGILPYAKLMRLLGNDRPKIVYEIDDALTMVPEDHIDHANCCAVSPWIEEYLRKADLVTVSTEPLKAYFAEYNRNIVVLPNALDMRLWAHPWQKRPPGHPVRILFSGTLTHSADLRIIEGALEKIVGEFGDRVEILFWGNTSARLQRAPQARALHAFLPDYAAYAQRLQRTEADFAVIPLEDSPFNKAKSAIKWIEYSACRIPGIYSNVDAYNTVVADGQTGLLVNNTPEEWHAAIKKMIVDPSGRQRLAVNAHAALLLDHTVAGTSSKWLHAYRSLLAPVSVIIPVFNQVDYTRKCMDALRRHPPTGRYEIIIVDNGSTDGTADFLQALNDPRVTVVSNPVNLGFAKACNQGARAASHPYLLFLNNDTEPTRHWFRPLAAILDNDPTVGAVGSKLILPDGRLQHAGIIVTDDRSSGDPLLARHIYYGQPSDLPEANRLCTYQAITAACLLVRKSAFEGVGGFDEGYWNGYEDVDFCFRLRERHWKLVYQPASVVVHHESKSGGERFARANQNIARLHARWAGKIKPDRLIRRDGSIAAAAAEGIQPYAVPLESGPELRGFCRARRRKMVSIVILTLNQLKYTRECVASLRRHTPEAHEIIFVDNGSSDGTVKWLRRLVKKHAHYQLIENKENRGFSKGCNQGIEASSGEYILLLNNDVVVTADWLARLLECHHSGADTGIVGPMTNRISGPQQVPAVGYASLDGLAAYARAFGEKNRHRRISQARIVGFCMLFHSRLVEDIGFLDERFGSGNFEDDDYCLRAALAGYRNVIAGDVFIHHYGSRSFIGNGISLGAALTGNRKIFSAKWCGTEAAQQFGRKLVALDAITRANEGYRRGQLDLAISTLLEGIQQTPTDKELYFTLAQMLIASKRYQDAAELLDAMRLDDADTRRLVLAGTCEAGLGRHDNAEACADRALGLDPSLAPAMNLKGVVALRRGARDAAERFFRQAIEADPSFGEPYTHWGSLKWDAGERAAALDLFERGFVLAPAAADAATAYHSASAACGAFERAEEVFREAGALCPADKRIAFLLIAVLIQQQKHERAMERIERAMTQFGIDEGMLAAALKVRAQTGPHAVHRIGSAAPRLSLCMIVKNEAAHLARCLMSVKPIVDEMIVVDTGSTDRTREVAAAFGAKVFESAWAHDFSAARNVSLSKASGDWILVLDADEAMAAADHGRLRKRIEQKPARRTAYKLTTRNYTDQVGSRGWAANDGVYVGEEAGRGWVPSLKVRLFPNDPRIRFVNPVHELVEPTLAEAGVAIEACDIPVHHYGRLDPDKVRAKGEDYYRLGMKKIQAAAGDPEALKELAVQAAELGKYHEALTIWEKVLECGRPDAVAYMNVGYAHLMLNRYAEAAAFSKKALELDPDMREAALNYSGCELIAGNAKSAIALLESMLQKEPDYPPAMARIAAAYFIERRREEGRACLERLHRKGFDCSSVLAEQSKAFYAQNRIDQALALIDAAIETNHVNPEIHELLAACTRLKEGGRSAAADSGACRSA